MKKLFLSLAIMCGACLASAQVVSGYEFEASQGTYTAITGGVVMNTTGMEETMYQKVWFSDGIVSSNNSDEVITRTGFPIGFDFEFNDLVMNQFAIGTSGYIALGCDEVSVKPQRTGFILSDEEGLGNVVGAAHKEKHTIVDSTEVSYLTTGEAPNRVLTVQFKNLPYGLDWSGTVFATLNMQIKLYETSNNIEIVFGQTAYPEGQTSEKDFRIGLRGTDDDRLLVMRPDYENEYEFLELVARNKYTIETTTVSVGPNTIPQGATYKFTAPAACETPEGEIESLEIITTTDGLSGDFAPVADADHYLVLLTESAYTPTITLTDGTRYAEGDEVGSSVVLSYNNLDTVVLPGSMELKAANNYVVTVVPVNAFCFQGPLYGTPCHKLVKTAPAAPASIKVLGQTTTSLTLSAATNGTDSVIVLVTDSILPNDKNYPYEFIFGDLNGKVAVGDSIDNASRVVHMGGSNDNIVVEGLEPGKPYFVRAYSYDRDYIYSSTYVMTYDATVSLLPWTGDFSYMADYGDVTSPAGWDMGNFKITTQASAYGSYNTVTTDKINSTEYTVYELGLPKVVVDNLDAAFTVGYTLYTQTGFSFRLTRDPYNEWTESDSLEFLISRNGGEYESVLLYTKENNPQAEVYTEFVPVEIDLNDYVNDTISIRVRFTCGSLNNAYLIFDNWSIAGRPIPVVPVVSVSDITWNSAKATWRGEQDYYEVKYGLKGEEYQMAAVEDKEFELTNLLHESEYTVRVRGVITEVDSMEFTTSVEYTKWSEPVTFTTQSLPACPIPTDLVSKVEENNDVTLTWTALDEHLTFDLDYRMGSTPTWNKVTGLRDSKYVLTDLASETLYIWRVKAYCDMERESKNATNQEFTTNAATSGVEAVTAEDFKVAVENGTVVIINNGVYVENVALYDIQGRVLNNFDVNSVDNILIPTTMKGIAIVRVTTPDNQFVYRVSVK